MSFQSFQVACLESTPTFTNLGVDRVYDPGIFKKKRPLNHFGDMAVTVFFHTLTFRITDFVCALSGILRAGTKPSIAAS